MNWIERYKLRHYVHNSIWLLPVFGMAAGLMACDLATTPATGLRVRACGYCHL